MSFSFHSLISLDRAELCLCFLPPLYYSLSSSLIYSYIGDSTVCSKLKEWCLSVKYSIKYVWKRVKKTGQLDYHMKGEFADFLWRTTFEIANWRLLQCVRAFGWYGATWEHVTGTGTGTGHSSVVGRLIWSLVYGFYLCLLATAGYFRLSCVVCVCNAVCDITTIILILCIQVCLNFIPKGPSIDSEVFTNSFFLCLIF